MNGCLLCGSSAATELHRGSDRLYATTDKIFAVVRCQACGLVRIDPQPPDAELHRYYPKQYWFEPKPTLAGRLEEVYRKLMLRDHVAFAKKVLAGKRARRVLDVGCGGGLFLRELREPGIEVFGLDVSVEAAKVAMRQNQVPVTVSDLQAAPFASGSWDLITMYHVLEHVPAPPQFLRAVAGLLAPGGSLIAQVPNLDCWQYRVFGAKWSGLDIPRHLNDFRLSDMRRMMEGCGFEIVRVKHFSWRDNPAGVVTSLFPNLEPVARVVRRLDGGPLAKLGKDLLYLCLVMLAVPFAALEAAFGKGSSVMIEARPKR